MNCSKWMTYRVSHSSTLPLEKIRILIQRHLSPSPYYPASSPIIRETDDAFHSDRGSRDWNSQIVSNEILRTRNWRTQIRAGRELAAIPIDNPVWDDSTDFPILTENQSQEDSVVIVQPDNHSVI